MATATRFAAVTAPVMAAEDPAQRRALVRMKVFATGLLVLAAGVYLLARANEEGGPAWVGYVRAGAEAAMVGALADWFAVTALFRHPLGLPIPHTAIIPKRKDQIGRSLGEFVQGNFLTRDVIAERLAGVHVGQRLGRWLAEPAHAERAAGVAGDAVKGVVEVLDDDDVEDALGGMVERRLRQVDVAPLLGRAIDVRVEGGHDQRLLDAVLKGLGTFLEENRDTLRGRLHTSRRGGCRNRSTTASSQDLHRRAALPRRRARPTPTTRSATRSRSASLDLADRLRTDPVMIAKAEELKEELLSRPRSKRGSARCGRYGQEDLARVGRRPQSDAAGAARRRAAPVRRAARRRPELQRKIDHWVERTRSYVVDNYKSEVGDLIETTIARWDADEHVAAHRAAGRSRPPVHPHQRHGRRRHRRHPHLQRRPAPVLSGR